VIAAQDVHREYGGVVPELASRAHLDLIGPTVERALVDAEVSFDRLDGIAVTRAPGLMGSLLVASATRRRWAPRSASRSSA
jgi:N6-L-threonylcarbamoyladenine synthase